MTTHLHNSVSLPSVKSGGGGSDGIHNGRGMTNTNTTLVAKQENSTAAAGAGHRKSWIFQFLYCILSDQVRDCERPRFSISLIVIYVAGENPDG